MESHAVTAKERMDHHMERYGKIRESDFEACRQALAKPIEVDRPIDVYFQRVEYTIHFTQYGKTPSTPNKIVQIAYHNVDKKDLHSLELKGGQKKVATDQM